MNARSLVSEFFVEPETNAVSEVCTIPNLITFLGIILVFVYVSQIFLDIFLFLAPITIFLVGTTDLFDGFLARKLNKHTKIGKFLDSFRDKLLTAGLCFSIFWLNKGVLTPIIIWISCEIILLGRDLLCFKKESMQTHSFSKIGQAITLLCVGLFLIQQFWLSCFFLSLNLLLWTIAITAIVNCILICSFSFRK